eukprot:m.118916 g.118916  ORF g.118916 m.118916 type:complete len:319 (-) comp13269_c0_seq1:74-1030(-)
MAAVTIQRAWRGYWDRAVAAVAQHTAAVMIQAAWRGFWLRKRMGLVKDSALFDDPDDFAYEEVDLAQFDLEDDDDLDNARADSVLGGVAVPRLPRGGDTSAGPASPELPAPPLRGGWVNPPSVEDPAPEDRRGESRESDAESPPHPPSRGGTTRPPRTPRPPCEPKKRSPRTEERVREEWGFKDSRTAAMMLKRSKRMSGARKPSKQARHSCPNRLSLVERSSSRTSATPTGTPSAPRNFRWDHGDPVLHHDLQRQLDSRPAKTPPLPPIPAGRQPRQSWAGPVGGPRKNSGSRVVAEARGVLPPIHVPAFDEAAAPR